MSRVYRRQLIITVGVPGSGKSTIVNTDGMGYWHVSPDAVRFALYGDEAAQGDSAVVFAAVHRMTVEALDSGQSVIVDATNLHPEHRAPLLKIAADHGVVASAWRITTPLPVCWLRNHYRARRVPVRPMWRMTVAWLRHCRRPVLHAEGWHVFEVRP